MFLMEVVDKHNKSLDKPSWRLIKIYIKASSMDYTNDSF